MAGSHTLAPLTSMDLPRVKLAKFDGSSHDYLKFIRQFEFYVASRTTDDGQKAKISNSRFGTIADQTNKCRADRTTLSKQPIKRQRSLVNAVFKTPESSPLCREPHPLKDCVKFAEFGCSKRWDMAKGYKVCFRCLKAGHMTKACNTGRKCGVN
ncbi:hypothetical protein X801_08327 [Opisthorchis viverrini]|uniref:CCHC-type domain-containing protein n=1 Tax=Opisthorchis viverrini TaxID=6198 RepID=A0A1S8WN67_OPIVI|nr:hypothetical protein X801_08327 [Opisthorchis viverrini]